MKSQAPIPVLHFTNSTARGGAEEHILTLLRKLDRDRFRLHLVVTPEVAQKLQGDVPADVETIALRYAKPTQVNAALTLRRILRERKIQILHSHLFYSSLFASPVGRAAGVPVMIETPHVRELWRKGWKSSFAIDRIVGRCVDGWIAVSQANADYLVQQKGLPSRKVHVVHNGCDIRRFTVGRVASPELRKSMNVAATDTMAIVLARLEPQKGHTYLLEALPAVIQEFPRLKVVFIGEGQLRESLEAQTRTLRLENAVRFAGYQSNASEWLAACDFTILPSLFEGLPLVAIESLAAGKAVIATAVDGTPEIVVDHQTGLLVPPQDPHALADALRSVMRNPQLLAGFAQAGRNSVEKDFTEEAQVRKTEEVYLRLWQEKTGERLGPGPDAVPEETRSVVNV